MTSTTSLDHAEEWAVFKHRRTPLQTRRTGKRLVRDGVLPGYIEGDRVYVYVNQWLAAQGSRQAEVNQAAAALLKG